MTSKGFSLAAAVLFAATITTQAAAQSCTGNNCSVNNTASVSVPSVMRLTLNSATTTLTNPVEAAFDAGFQDDAGPTATVKSNRPWNLTDRKSTRLNSSHLVISYAVFCLKKTTCIL